MNHDDRKIQELLDDRLGERRDAGMRSATLDPETRRALGAYKAVYRALREDPPSRLPADFATRVADQAFGVERNDLAPWQVAALAAAIGGVLCVASMAALGAGPGKLLGALGGPLAPVALALALMPFADRALARWFSAH